MDDTDDIHQTARTWFTAKIVNGAIPEVWEGIRYFAVTLEDGGQTYWITENGCFTPPENED